MTVYVAFMNSPAAILIKLSAFVIISSNSHALSPKNNKKDVNVLRFLFNKAWVLLDHGKHYNVYRADYENRFIVKVPNNIADDKVLLDEYKNAKEYMGGLVPPSLKIPSPDKKIFPSSFVIIQPFLISLDHYAKNWYDLFFIHPERDFFKKEFNYLFLNLFKRGIFWNELPKLSNFAFDSKREKLWIIDFGEPELISSDRIFKKRDEVASDRRFWRKDSGNYVLTKFPQEFGFILDSCNIPSDSDIKKIWGKNKGLYKVETFEFASDSENLRGKNLTGVSL